jgi:hypothetical protein
MTAVSETKSKDSSQSETGSLSELGSDDSTGLRVSFLYYSTPLAEFKY